MSSGCFTVILYIVYVYNYSTLLLRTEHCLTLWHLGNISHDPTVFCVLFKRLIRCSTMAGYEIFWVPYHCATSVHLVCWAVVPASDRIER